MQTHEQEKSLTSITFDPSGEVRSEGDVLWADVRALRHQGRATIAARRALVTRS